MNIARHATPTFLISSLFETPVFSYEMAGCEVIWVVKDEVIGNRFLDEGAAAFFLQQLNSQLSDDDTCTPQLTQVKKQKFVAEQPERECDKHAQGTPF